LSNLQQLSKGTSGWRRRVYSTVYLSHPPLKMSCDCVVGGPSGTKPVLCTSECMRIRALKQSRWASCLACWLDTGQQTSSAVSAWALSSCAGGTSRFGERMCAVNVTRLVHFSRGPLCFTRCAVGRSNRTGAVQSRVHVDQSSAAGHHAPARQ
jgi:hypothetical protein